MLAENVNSIRIGLITLSVVVSIYFFHWNLYYHENKEPVEETVEAVAEAKASEDKMFEQLVSTADLDTTNANIQLQVARMFLEREQAKEAVKYYHRYEKLEAPTADLFAEIGTVMWLSKPSAKSVMYFTKSLNLDSVNAGALFGLGRATLDIGDKKGAIKLFKKIVKAHQGEEIAKAAASWIENIEKLEIEPSKESK